MNELDVLTRMCPAADSFDPNLKAQLRASLFGVVAERDDTSSDDFVAELIHATPSGESSGLAKAGRSGRPRRRWPVLAAAAILAVAMVAGLVVLSLRSTPTDRLVTSAGFDGQPIPVTGGRFVPLGLNGAPGWNLQSSADGVEGRMSFCRRLASDGTCDDLVGSTRSVYTHDGGGRVEITNEFGPLGSTSNMWQFAIIGTPLTVRGHPAGAVSQPGQDPVLAWSESDTQHVLLRGTGGTLTVDQLKNIAESLASSSQAISVRLISARSIDTDDNDPQSVGAGLLSLVVGKINNTTCVALIGFNWADECKPGFDPGDGPRPAIAGRVLGSRGQSVVAAILPAATTIARVDRLELPPIDVTPISIAGFSERFVLETMGTTFPTRIHAIDAHGSEIEAFDVDPLFGTGFARGVTDGWAWDLNLQRECLVLSDVNSGADDCGFSGDASPHTVSPTGITTGAALSFLQFGRAGNHVAAVTVGGISYPTISIPNTDLRAWVAPLGGWPIAVAADGTQLHYTAIDPVPPASYCDFVSSIASGKTSLDDSQKVNSIQDDPSLTEHQRLLVGVAVNHALNQHQHTHPWDNTMLVTAINDICHLNLKPTTITT